MLKSNLSSLQIYHVHGHGTDNKGIDEFTRRKKQFEIRPQNANNSWRQKRNCHVYLTPLGCMNIPCYRNSYCVTSCSSTSPSSLSPTTLLAPPKKANVLSSARRRPLPSSLEVRERLKGPCTSTDPAHSCCVVIVIVFIVYTSPIISCTDGLVYVEAFDAVAEGLEMCRS